MKYLICALLACAGQEALALQPATIDNLQALEDKLREHVEDGYLQTEDLTPLTLIEVSGDTEDAKALTNAILHSLGQALNVPILMCEACQATYRQTATESIYSNGIVEIDDVKRVYEKQKSMPKAAAWVRFNRSSISIRIVSMETSRVLFADTVDTSIDWSGRSIQSFSRSREAERSARGDAIVHGQIDFSPIGHGTHMGYSLMQQWGDSNQYLSGLSVNLTDPLLGIGLNTFKVFPEFNNMLMGGKFLISIPSALSSALSKSSSNALNQSPYTLVAMVKYPMFRNEPAKYLVNAYISTNANFGIGITW